MSPTHLFTFSCVRPVLLTSFALYIFTAFPSAVPTSSVAQPLERALSLGFCCHLRSAAGQSQLDQTPVQRCPLNYDPAVALCPLRADPTLQSGSTSPSSGPVTTPHCCRLYPLIFIHPLASLPEAHSRLVTAGRGRKLTDEAGTGHRLVTLCASCHPACCILGMTVLGGPRRRALRAQSRLY